MRRVGELAHVLLGKPMRPERPALLIQELRRDAWALIRCDLEPVPALTSRPLFEKEPALPERRGEANDAPRGDREHRADGVIQLVRNPGCLVDHEESDTGEAAH